MGLKLVLMLLTCLCLLKMFLSNTDISFSHFYTYGCFFGCVVLVVVMINSYLLVDRSDIELNDYIH